jgi:hypothetical protein
MIMPVKARNIAIQRHTASADRRELDMEILAAERVIRVPASK